MAARFSNPKSLRVLAFLLAVPSDLGLLPAAFWLVLGLYAGGKGLFIGLALAIGLGFNLVVSSQVLGNERSGKWLIPVVAVWAALIAMMQLAYGQSA